MSELTNKQLQPYWPALRPLQGTKFSGAISAEAWRQLAIVLAEESADLAHARRIVESFVRTPRYDAQGELQADIPSTIELRIFARSVPRQEIPSAAPEPCEECGDFPGWRPVEINGCDYRQICTCARGQWQAAAIHARANTGA